MNTAFKAVFLLFWISAAAFGVTASEKQVPTFCKFCSMHLDPSDKKFSVTISEAIEASAFDDIGCALIWRDGECAMRTSAFDSNARVYDYETGEPIVIEQAFFVHGAGLKTPMGYDFAAFKKKEDAEKLRRERGKGDVLTFRAVCSIKTGDLQRSKN